MRKPSNISQIKANLVLYSVRNEIYSFADWLMLTSFSGVQPFGRLHLGNYFSAIKWMLDAQRETLQRYFCVVDLHSLTSKNRKNISADSINACATLLACGLDPSKTVLFRQSDILEHANLMWLLLHRVSTNQLRRMIQWKVFGTTLQCEIPYL
jgi:tryptophanyl-tRNA synthetase